MKKGCFISFEGMDGSGKSTQIRKLKSYLEKRGYDVILTREPGGTSIGEKLREIILDPENKEMKPMTEAFLYAASRSQHVEEVIKPALEAGKIVICDRFADSSIAYQGYGRGLDEEVKMINEYAVCGCIPDCTFLMRIDLETGNCRIGSRKRDRIELEEESFHKNVYRGYEALGKSFPERITVIDATGTIEEIFDKITERVDRTLDI